MRYLTLLTLITVLMLVGMARAGSAYTAGPNLMVNGVVAIHFLVGDRELSAERRAVLVVHRLKQLPYWGLVTVKGQGTMRTLMIGPDPLLAVNPKDAELGHTTVSELALAWASSLQEALNMPPLKVSDNFVQIAVGRSQVIQVTGSSSSKASASSSDPKVATALKLHGAFEIKGLKVGTAIVSVAAGNAQENIRVTVEPYAASLPQEFVVLVSGAPATPETVEGAAEMALKTRLVALPDAQVSFSTPGINPLESGQSVDLKFLVSATSPTGISTRGSAKVTVKNIALSKRDDNFLWYSNQPETVKRSQSLFSASLKKDNSVRLLYHHVNGTMEDLYLRVEVVNDSKIPAEMAITPGDSKPNLDPVKAGLFAAIQFFHGWIDGSAEVMTIPPGSVLPISFRRLSPGETGSGLCELRLVGGPSDVLVRTDSLPPLQLDAKWISTIFTSTPWHEVGCHPLNIYDNIPCEANPHVYADPYTDNHLAYTVGGRYGYCRLGEKPLSQTDREGSLDGNFGVFDKIQTDLSNPSSNPIDIEIVFEASAGYSAGIFVINGHLEVTRMLAPKDTERIARIHLEPGAVKKFDMVTLPLSGSSYPATIFARPILQMSQ